MNLNPPYQESCPALSLDGRRPYFASNRPGGLGWQDLYVSRRRDRTDDYAWQPPVHLGCVLKSPQLDVQPSIFEDDTGTEVMNFNSTRESTSDPWAAPVNPKDPIALSASGMRVRTG